MTFNGHPIYRVSYRNTVSYFLRVPDGNRVGRRLLRHRLPVAQAACRRREQHACGRRRLDRLSRLERSGGDRAGDHGFRARQRAAPCSSTSPRLDPRINPNDHSDHLMTAKAALDAVKDLACVRRVYYVDYASSRLPENLDAQQRDMESSVFAVTLAGVLALTMAPPGTTTTGPSSAGTISASRKPAAAATRPRTEIAAAQALKRCRRVDAGQSATERLLGIGQYARSGSRRLAWPRGCSVGLRTMRAHAAATAADALRRGRRRLRPGAPIASVDALRGFNIFWILGGDGAILGARRDDCAARGRSLSGIGHFLGTQLTHVPWEGFRFYDFIFPLFIFITGVAIVLSLPRLVEREGKAQGASARAAPRAAALWPGADLLRRHQRALERHPLARRAAAHRALLSVRVAAVPELQSARA